MRDISNPEFFPAVRPEARKELVADASEYGLGAVLLQLEEGKG